jgi:S-phase kinase-associated protein 1
MSSNSMVTLVSTDGISVQATLQAVNQCITLRSMLEDLDDEQTIGVPIPIPEVEGEVLKKVMEWCEYHREDAHIVPPEETDSTPARYRPKEVPEWDSLFLMVHHNLLIRVINAANYLDIPLLLQYGISTVAVNLWGMTTPQMREFLNIQNDLTAEQEDRIRRENNWVKKRQITPN